MPRGGTSVTSAFEKYVGAVPGSTKMTYVGQDKFGNRTYKFTYQFRTMRGTATSTNTMAVIKDGRAFQFVRPNSAAANQPIAGQDDVEFRQDTLSEWHQRALVKVGELQSRGHLTPTEAKQLAEQIPNMSETSARILAQRGGAFAIQPAVTEGEIAQDDFSDLFAPSFGGGGGGGFAGPVYRRPDERVVRDFVKGTLVSLVGEVPEHLVGPAVETFMRDHRADFDNPEQEIDPSQSVVELIRGTEEYQTIHELRPESVDEREWISSRAREAQRGGLDTGEVEQFAIEQATVGGDLPDVAEAAAVRQFQRSSQAPALLDNQFRQVAQAMFQGVVV